MTPWLLRAVAAIVRGWTTLYTKGLAGQLRERRREEIASDLWHDLREVQRQSPGRLAAHILARLVLGIPDDFRWRIEHAALARQRGRAILIAAASLATVGLIVQAVRSELPPVPGVPLGRADFGTPQAPPPPPPAPSRHADTAADPARLTAAYGTASYTVTADGVAPVRIKEVRPIYPPILRAAAVKGIVIVEATITDAGRVMDPRVVQPAGLLTQPVVDAIQRWEFAPSRRSESAGRNTLTVSVRFGPES